MEAASLVLIGVIFLAFRIRRRTGGKNQRARSDKAPSPPTRISSAGTPGIVPPPFSPETAKHLPSKHVVKGAAYVTDGDTITICKTQIRLFGIDAPEIDHPYGKKAKWALVKLCKGHTVTAEVTEKDHYGRTVARCTLPDGRDLSAEMVKMGLAIDWAKFSGGTYRHMETPDARRKLWLADARQKGRMHVWQKFEQNRS